MTPRHTPRPTSSGSKLQTSIASLVRGRRRPEAAGGPAAPPFLFRAVRGVAGRFGGHAAWERSLDAYLYASTSTARLHRVRRGSNKLFQVVGLPRSGTTLLEGLIGRHSSIACLSEPFREWAMYGRVTFERARRTSMLGWGVHPVRVVKKLARREDYAWVGFKETSLNPEDPAGLFVRRNHTEGAVDATIALVRDPRDVWISLRDYMDAHRDDRPTAWWSNVEDWYPACWTAYCQWLLDEGIFFVRYEDLVADPERTARSITAHLGLNFEPHMLTLAWRKGAGDDRALNGGGISGTSVSRYRTALSAADVKAIEGGCGEMMLRMGYPLSE